MSSDSECTTAWEQKCGLKTFINKLKTLIK